MEEPMSVHLTKVIAEEKNVGPNELDLTLQDYIDTGSITSLAERSSTSWSLSFSLPNHEVTVESNGSILIDGVHKATYL